MFGLLSNLASAAIKVAVLPVAVVVDVATLPASAMDLRKGAFDRSAKVVDSIGDSVDKALEE